MPFFLSDGFAMHYEVFPGIVPTDTLFIHGNLASNAWWYPTIDALGKLDATKRGELSGSAVLGEWRGFGKSRELARMADLNPGRLARDYLNLLSHLGIQHAQVVGHSTGGMIALHAMKEEPSRFERAVLLNSLGINGIPVSPETRSVLIRMARDHELCASALATTIRGVDANSSFFRGLVEDAFESSPFVWEGVPRMISEVRMGEWISSIRQPTLVVHGDSDPILPLADSRELASRLPNGEFLLLEGYGHSPNLENPASFAGVLRRFLYASSAL